LRSLLIRIFLSFWLIIGITIGIAAFAGFYYSERMRESMENFEHGDAILEASKALDEDGREGLVQWLSDFPNTRGITIYVLDENRHDLLGRRLPGSIARLMSRHRQHMWAREHGRNEPPNLRWARPLSQLVSADGQVFTFIVMPSRRPPAYLGIAIHSYVLFVVALIVSGIVSYLLARAIANPIRKLRDATVALADGNLDVRVGSSIGKRHDELGMLASDFDSMANRLARAAAQQTELSQNISHELRSPLARMRVALELARRQAGDLPEFERISAEAERLDDLIAQILSYTRMDASPQIEPVRIDLADLIKEVVGNVNYECESDGIDGVSVRASFDASPIVLGYTDALTSAVENILRNAVRHSPANGIVDVKLNRKNTIATIEILDQGPGVDESELPRLFEPFYRTRGAPESGTGLGLAIAQRAIRLNGGEVIASNRAEAGLQVIVTLPVSPSS
jgi:two-component system sensor histidine kinase CpxA